MPPSPRFNRFLAVGALALAFAGVACGADDKPTVTQPGVEDVSTTTVPADPTTTTAPAATSSSAPAATATTQAPATTSTTARATTTTTAKPATTTTQAPTTTTTEPEVEEAYYANCDAARAAGVAPIMRGQPGYRTGLDRDGDGVACDA